MLRNSGANEPGVSNDIIINYPECPRGPILQEIAWCRSVTPPHVFILITGFIYDKDRYSWYLFKLVLKFIREVF